MTQGVIERELITEEWLASVGFKWHQFERQPTKQWLLWLGRNAEDLGIELAGRAHMGPRMDIPAWFCWLRSDTAGRYHRFIHVRYLRFQDEVMDLVRALSGQHWDPDNHWYGAVVTPERAARLRTEDDRLDKKIAREGHPWYESEKDPTRARPTSEDQNAAIESGLAK